MRIKLKEMKLGMQILFLMMITICSSTSFCNHKKSGFYCNSDHSYLWCYGHPYPTEMMCPIGTSCRCGYSPNNPCGFHQQVLQECYGSFEENIPSKPPNEPPSEPLPPDTPVSPPENDNNNNNDSNNDNNNNNDDNQQSDEIETSESFEEIDYCTE